MVMPNKFVNFEIQTPYILVNTLLKQRKRKGKESKKQITAHNSH